MTVTKNKTIPLCVDLDGTLLRSDMLIETGMAFLRSHALEAHKLLGWLRVGKARLKSELARRSGVEVDALPFEQRVVQLMNEAKGEGREVILATACHELLAKDIAQHFGFFDDVIATNDQNNLSAHNKREALVNRFGEQGFDYVGNSHDDVVVWEAARHAYIVNPDRGVEQRARRVANVVSVSRTNNTGARSWIKACRLHQWLKNALIFVPLLASHQVASVDNVLQGLLAFLLFGLCASSVYILNDLLDLSDDRHHPTKRKRPFACGDIPVRLGVIAFPIMLVVAFGTAILLLPPAFAGVLLGYYGLTLSYSLWIKRLMALDVIALASLYTIRIIAGATALNLPLTFWVLAFSMFIFLSLALVKRYAELKDARDRGDTGKARGRGYYPDDLEMVSSLGAASGLLSVMVLALYIQDPGTQQLYANPELIWVACPMLLFWVTRVWLLTHRGEMHDDPVVFAVKDKVSLFTGALFGLVFILAT